MRSQMQDAREPGGSVKWLVHRLINQGCLLLQVELCHEWEGGGEWGAGWVEYGSDERRAWECGGFSSTNPLAWPNLSSQDNMDITGKGPSLG